jgi:hypothetical protein
MSYSHVYICIKSINAYEKSSSSLMFTNNLISNGLGDRISKCRINNRLLRYWCTLNSYYYYKNYYKISLLLSWLSSILPSKRQVRERGRRLEHRADGYLVAATAVEYKYEYKYVYKIEYKYEHNALHYIKILTNYGGFIIIKENERKNVIIHEGKELNRIHYC